MNRRTNEISDGYQSQNPTQISDFHKEATMINVMLKPIISLAILPVIILVNSQSSLASIGRTKTAESNLDIGKELIRFPGQIATENHLKIDNFDTKIMSSNQVDNNQIRLMKAEANSKKNRPWFLEHLLTAARNEKTRECRVSGICS
jgi:hypothetical protein